MISRIYLLLLVAMLPLSAQSSLNDGGRIVPQNQQTVQPAATPGAAKLRPGVTAPPPGAPIPPDEMPAAPAVHCYLKEFTVRPSVFRQGMIYKDDLKTMIKLNVPAPHHMVFHVITNDPTKVTCTDIVFVKNAQTAYGGVKIIWGTIEHDSTFELKAYSEDEPDTILHGRLYLKPKYQ
jgi:hypothetical protein